MKILLVDDDPMMRRLGQLSLGDVGGMTVTAASSGDEALRLAGEAGVDVVLLDLEMPGLSGAETLRALKASPATAAIPVIILSGRAPAPDEVEGAVGVLSKPFDPMTLASQVTGLLG